MPQQPTLTFQLFSPGIPQGDPSLFDLNVLSSSNPAAFPPQWYDSWCLDRATPIGVPFTYTGTVYSSYEYNILRTNFTTLGDVGAPLLPGSPVPLDAAHPANPFVENLDIVNWLLNNSQLSATTYNESILGVAYSGIHYYNVTGLGANNYTFGDIQQTIYQLLGDGWSSNPFLGSADQTRVAQIVAQAVTHDGYVPEAGEKIGVVVDPGLDSSGNQQQPLIIQTRAAALGDRVWHDTDADGIQDGGETGISGVVVKLVRDLNNDGDFDDLNEVLATATTGTNGDYIFKGLTPGLDYQVMFMTPAGYDGVSPRQADGDPASHANSDGPVSNVVVLSAGEYNPTIDAGFYKTVSVGNYVWNDVNQDGIQNDGATGIGGVALTLTGTAGNGAPIVRNTATNADGSYLFDGLPPGTYQVTVDPANFVPGGALEGYVASPLGQGGNPALDSNATPSGTTPVFLPSGADDLTLDFGYYRPKASLGDRLWVDINGDGIQNDGNSGIVGATVTLIGGGADKVIGTADDTTATTSTGTDGFYQFTGLNVGEQYQVQFAAPGGMVFTGKDLGGDDTLDSDVDPATGKTQIVTLSSGEHNPTLDAGVYKPAELGDKVWNDTNANGQQDNGENGIAGVRVELYACVNNQPAGPMLAFQNTDANGDYAFTGLKPGDYIVKFITPAGYTLTTANVGADDSDSDAGVGGLTGCYNLESGETDNTVDAGMYRAAIDIEKFVRGEYQTGGNGGTEGLTPGFWKTHSEFGPAPLAGWPETGYSPTQSWEAVFGKDVPGTPTLLDALNTGGGGLNALLRHSTAALLNAANPNVDYAYSTAQVISMTQSAITSGNYDATKNLFEAQNELGADLSTPAPSATTVVTPDFDADTPGSGPQIPVGGKAVFTYVVKNTGSVEISNIAVTDNRLSGLTFTGGDTDNDGKLDLTETWTWRAEEIVTTSAEVANMGTVTGTGGTIPVTDSDAAHYNGTALSQSLGDYIWLDANRNGLQDAGEAGIGGLLVTLIGGGADGIINGIGDTTATTNTDADGYYQFNNLAAGVQYQVMFSKPTGTVYTTQNVGANDAIDSDANVATGKSQIVTLAAGQNNPTLDAGVYVLMPGIDIEKTTNGPTNSNPVAPDYDNEDAPNGAGVPILTAGSTVTWTYKVTNTGETNFAKADIAIVDDNGTPANAADDMSIANGKITYVSGDDGDNVLEVGESWIYKASGIVQSLGGLGTVTTMDFSGSSATDGTDGNTRAYTAGGVTVNANAWSRDKGTDTWQQAWLGAYGGGLGVTDSSEGSGGSNTHTVDNNGRDNYIVFQFSQNVVVDKAFLGYVVGDSDMTVYVGSTAAPISNMSNAVLSSMALKEFNDTALTTTRWADFNAGNAEGNVLILAARDDGHSADYFKVQQLVFQAVQSGGVYANKATVTAGGLSDSDMSHYVTTAPKPGIEIIKDASVASAAPNTPVTYTYAVKNTGGVALGNIVVKDDNGTPNYAGDDFSPAAVLGANGKNVGDLDGDNLLDTNEVWKYSATVTPPVQMTVTVNGVVYDSGTLSYTTLANGDIRVTYLQSQGINDNNYAASGNAPTWNRTHTFSNLTGSDKAGFELKDGNGMVVLKFYQDYLTATSTNTDGYTSFSGYASLGATGGDGSMVVGSAANLYDFDTTLELNLNRAGYTGMTSNSPVGDANWDYVNGYMFTVKASAFGAAGFGGVMVFDQHNSPPKVGTNSMIPEIKYGPSTNIATVTGTAGGTTVSDTDDATVNIQAPARIGDRVWCDTNGNGVQDAGEVGIAGVTVKLLSTTGTVLATTTTDSNGSYSFSAMPGTYKVHVVKPAAFAGFTAANVGSNDAVDSDVDSTGTSGVITVASGQYDTSVDAGLAVPTVTLTYDFSGNSATDGTDGNTRSYTVDGVTVSARAVSRHVDSKGNVMWETAWLGAYGGGLGVTDRGEGTGSGNAHTVDNVGRLNYVIFQFSQDVVVDKTFLGYVVGDSDLTAWIGSSSTTLTNLSDSLLAGMTKEANDTTSTTTRWADINAGAKAGNVLVIAASTSDTTPDDYFKIDQLVVSTKSATVTPIAIDLDDDGIETVARADAAGAFDLFGNGQAIRSGWLAGDDGFLAVDSNGNGKIDDITELFGGGGRGDAFAKLADYDSNGDSVVDANDAAFASLKVWRDANGNHQTDAGELMSLAEAGVASLRLAVDGQPFMDANGNLHLERSSATLADGSVVDMTDVYFNVAAADAAAAGVELPSLSELVGDGASLDGLLAGLGGGLSLAVGGAANAEVYDSGAADALRQMAQLYDQAVCA